MVRIILLPLLFTFYFTTIYTTSAADSAAVSSYYLLKNRAEIALIDSNYAAALSLYKDAFKAKSPNQRDLYNAFILAYIQQDSISAKKWFEEMVQNGLTIENLETIYFIKTIKKQPTYQWITEHYAVAKGKALNSPKLVYAKVLDSIFDIDQRAREWKNKGQPTEDEISQMIHVDTKNIKKLKSSIQQYGFPGYQQAGFFEKIYGGHINAQGTLWLVLWHTRHLSQDLNDLCLEYVIKGEFPPDEYALVYDSQNKSAYYFEIMPKSFGKDGISFTKPDNEEEINRRRAQLHLEPIDEFIRKLKFEERGGHPFYILPAWAIALNLMPMDFNSWNNGKS